MLSAVVEEKLVRALRTGEKVLATERSSFDRDRKSGASYVALTTRSICVGDMSSRRPLKFRRLPLKSVIGVQLEGGGAGHGALLISTSSRVAARIPFKRAEREAFERIASLIEKEKDRSAGKKVDPFKYLPREAQKLVKPTVPAPSPQVEDSSTWARVGDATAGYSIAIRLDDPRPAPGDTIEGSVEVQWPRERAIRGVVVRFRGAEQTRVRVYRRKWIDHREEARMEARQTLVRASTGPEPRQGTSLRRSRSWNSLPRMAPGRYRGRFSFALPAKAPPTYRGRNVSVKYEISAIVEVPLGFDLRARRTIRVGRKRPFGWSRSTGAFGLRDRKNLQAEVPLEIDISPRAGGSAGRVDGRFRFKNPKRRTLKKAWYTLVATERATAKGERDLYSWAVQKRMIPGRELKPGRWIPIGFPDPSGLPVYRGQYSSYRIGVKVKLEVAWAVDVSCYARLRTR